MFDNIGKKIKILASVGCWLGIIISILYAVFLLFSGFALIVDDNFSSGIVSIFTALLVGVIGSIASWISVWPLYAFGELVDKTEDNERNTKKIIELLYHSISSNNTHTVPTQPINQQSPNTNYQNSTNTNSNIGAFSFKQEDAKSVWIKEISSLSTEELELRYANSYEWSEEYRSLCKNEIDKRKSMEFCKNCGADITNDNKFCHVCGQAIT